MQEGKLGRKQFWREADRVGQGRKKGMHWVSKVERRREGPGDVELRETKAKGCNRGSGCWEGGRIAEGEVGW